MGLSEKTVWCRCLVRFNAMHWLAQTNIARVGWSNTYLAKEQNCRFPVFITTLNLQSVIEIWIFKSDTDILNGLPTCLKASWNRLYRRNLFHGYADSDIFVLESGRVSQAASCIDNQDILNSTTTAPVNISFIRKEIINSSFKVAF